MEKLAQNEVAGWRAGCGNALHVRYSSQCLSDLWGSCFDITHLAQVLISGTDCELSLIHI